jgi:Ca2+-binding EF-hand superfamily protein
MAELANLKAAFNAMDADASGFLERQEIIDGLKEHGYNFIDKEVDDMIASVDVDGNGKVDYSGMEFLPFFKQRI